MTVRLSGKALALFGIWNCFLFRLVLSEPYDQIGKFLEDEEEEETQQCAYYWELDEPISLASCV